MSQALSHLLSLMQAHPGFQELRERIPEPRIKPYRKGSDAIGSAADHFYASGQANQHQKWIAFLTGQASQTEE